jgi:hypothetical protein
MCVHQVPFVCCSTTCTGGEVFPGRYLGRQAPLRNKDIVDPPFETSSDSRLPVPTGPGTGVELMIGWPEKVTVQREESGA